MSSDLNKMMSLDKSTRGMELMSLQAIYPDEFETMNDTTGDVSFRLRVRPEIQLDMNFTEVDLVIALRPDYPETEASLMLSVIPVVGLSPGQLAMLEKELRAKIVELVGREMVFELAQTAQDFLRRYNVDPKKSIYDEMMEQQNRQQQQKELKAQEKAKQEREEARQIQQQQQAQRMVEKQEEQERRKKLFAKSSGQMRRKESHNKKHVAGGLWGSSEDEPSEDEDEEEEHADEANMGDAGKLHGSLRGGSELWSSSLISMSAATDTIAGNNSRQAASNFDSCVAVPPTSPASIEMRWKQVERIEYTAEGELPSPKLLGKVILYWLCMCPQVLVYMCPQER
jgi:hypothetical protein